MLPGTSKPVDNDVYVDTRMLLFNYASARCCQGQHEQADINRGVSRITNVVHGVTKLAEKHLTFVTSKTRKCEEAGTIYLVWRVTNEKILNKLIKRIKVTIHMWPIVL